MFSVYTMILRHLAARYASIRKEQKVIIHVSGTFYSQAKYRIASYAVKIPKRTKIPPPASVTVQMSVNAPHQTQSCDIPFFMLILPAIKLPPSTANAVHIRCPKHAPTMTQKNSCPAAIATVAIWDRSPSSPMNVMLNVSTQAGLSSNDNRFLIPPADVNERRDGDLDGDGDSRPLRPASREYAERCPPARAMSISFSSSSASTSRISSPTPALESISIPSLSDLAPKPRKSSAATTAAHFLDIMAPNAWPATADRIVMMRRADAAAVKT